MKRALEAALPLGLKKPPPPVRSELVIIHTPKKNTAKLSVKSSRPRPGHRPPSFVIVSHLSDIRNLPQPPPPPNTKTLQESIFLKTKTVLTRIEPSFATVIGKYALHRARMKNKSRWRLSREGGGRIHYDAILLLIISDPPPPPSVRRKVKKKLEIVIGDKPIRDSILALTDEGQMTRQSPCIQQTFDGCVQHAGE